MKAIANFLITRRRVILAAMLIIAAICLVLSLRVPINRDRTKYLADGSNMKQGLDIIDSDFPEAEEASSIRVMFDDLTTRQIAEVRARLEAIDNVSSVTYEADNPKYHEGNHTLFVVNSHFHYGSSEEMAIEEALEKDFPEYSVLYKNNDIPTTEVPLWLLATAIMLAVLVLLVMSDSWLDPAIILIVLGIAVAINFGTNIILPYIDEMTATVGPVLQLVLSMDYSIILLNRYRQEKQTQPDQLSAMKTALAGSISSIAASSLTTVVGLLALVFLSFKLGPELGIVLSKGVFISMITVCTVLPVLILAWDEKLEKARKRSFHPSAGKLAAFSHRIRYAMPVVFVVVFVGAVILQNQTAIVFSEDSEDPLAEIFPKENTAAVVYPTRDEGKLAPILSALETDGRISGIVCYSNTMGRAMDAEEMSDAICQLSSDTKIDESLVRMLYFTYEDSELPTPTAEEFMAFISESVLDNPTLSAHLDEDIRDNMEALEKFTHRETLITPMTAGEMAGFFGMGTGDVKDLFLYYFIQNGVSDSGTMTLPDFVDYVLHTVANDETYGSMLDATALSSLRQLQTYTDAYTMQKQCTVSELASMMDVDASTVKAVFLLRDVGDLFSGRLTPSKLATFLYDHSLINTLFRERYGSDSAGGTMSPEDFVDFILSDQLMSSIMDDDSLSQLRQLQAIIAATVNQTELTSSQLAGILGMDSSQAEQLYILRMSQYAVWRLSPRSFVAFIAGQVLQDERFAGNFDEKTAADLRRGHALIEAVVSEREYSCSDMYALLKTLADDVSESQVEVLYLYYGGVHALSGQTKLTIPQMFSFLTDDMLQDARFSDYFDARTRADILDSQETLDNAIAQLQGGHYSRLVLTSDYPDESPEAQAYIARLHTLCENNLEEYYLVGTSAMVSEMGETFHREYIMITLITAMAIFAVVFLTFRNLLLPLILTLVVQCGVFITVTVIGVYSGSIYYLALLIVQSILMGATIDYGIVFCNFYKEHRKTLGGNAALRAAYEGSLHTILTSGSILVLVLACLGTFAPSAMISEVCVTLSIGSLVAILLILFVLPGLVACCDKIVHLHSA